MNWQEQPPRRFRIKTEIKDRHFDAELRYGVYFPTTDLCVSDMGGRGTGCPTNVEWLDPEPPENNLHITPAEADEAVRLSILTRDPRWKDVGDEDDLVE